MHRTIPQHKLQDCNDIPYGASAAAIAEEDIADGQLVYASSANGLIQRVSLASSATQTAARGQLYVALDGAPANSKLGLVPWRLLTDIDTTAYADQGPVYLGVDGAPSATAGTIARQVGVALVVHATYGVLLLNPGHNYGEGAFTGSGSTTININDDALAATDEDATLRLWGGDGVAAPNNDIVRTYFRQDSSAEVVQVFMERSRNGAAYARVSPTLVIGQSGETTASLDATLRLEAATDAGANRTFTLTLQGQENVVLWGGNTMPALHMADGSVLQHLGGTSGTGRVVQRYAPVTSAGHEVRVYEATVSPSAISTNLLNVPANSVVRSVQANCESALTGGGTTVTWSIGIAGTVNKYGTVAGGNSLTKNGKLNYMATPARLASSEQIVLTGAAAGGAAAGDTALTAGSVRVRIVYETLVTLADAA